MRTLIYDYRLRHGTGDFSTSSIGSSREGKIYRQDSPWSCFVCFAAFLSCIVTQGIHSSFGLTYVALLKRYGQSKAVTAWVGSGALAISCLLSPLVSLLCRRYGYRLVTIFGGLTCALGIFLSAHAPSLPVIYITYTTIFGFGASCAYTCAFIVVTDYFSKWRSLATGITCAGSSCGMLIMIPVIQLLLRNYGLQTTFTILSFISLIPSFCGCTYNPSIRKALPISLGTGSTSKSRVGPFSWLDFSVWKIPTFTIYSISLTVMMLGYFVPRAHLARYCEELGISTDESSWFYFFIGLASLVGRVVFGQLCNFRRVNSFVVTQITAAIIGVAIILLPFARTQFEFIAYSLTIGFFDGGVNTPVALNVFECVGRERMAEGWGFFSFATGITISIGPPLAGYMADALGSYKVTLYLSGAFVICGSAIMFLLKCVKFTNNDLESCPIELKILPPSEDLHQNSKSSLSNETVNTNVSIQCSYMVMIV